MKMGGEGIIMGGGEGAVTGAAMTGSSGGVSSGEQKRVLRSVYNLRSSTQRARLKSSPLVLILLCTIRW